MKFMHRATGLCLALALPLSGCSGSDTKASPSSAVKGESAVRLRTRPAGIATTFAYVPALDLPAVELPSDKVLIRGSVTELTLTALDGESIPGTYTAPAGAGPFPAVIVQHGLSSSHQAMYGLQEALT
ncbi:MAG: hypothetical protein WBD02_04895, partial [Acidimicrobiia bacterium]